MQVMGNCKIIGIGDDDDDDDAAYTADQVMPMDI